MSAPSQTAEQSISSPEPAAAIAGPERLQLLLAVYNETCTQARQNEALREKVVTTVAQTSGILLGLLAISSANPSNSGAYPFVVPLFLIVLGLWGFAAAWKHDERAASRRQRIGVYRTQMTELSGIDLSSLDDEADRRHVDAYPFWFLSLQTHLIWKLFNLLIVLLGTVLLAMALASQPAIVYALGTLLVGGVGLGMVALAVWSLRPANLFSQADQPKQMPAAETAPEEPMGTLLADTLAAHFPTPVTDDAKPGDAPPASIAAVTEPAPPANAASAEAPPTDISAAITEAAPTSSTPAAEKAAKIMQSSPPVGIDAPMDKPARKRTARKVIKRKKPRKASRQKAGRSR